MSWTVKKAETDGGQFAVHVHTQSGDVQFPAASNVVEGSTFTIGSESFNVTSAKDPSGRGEAILTKVSKKEKPKNARKKSEQVPDKPDEGGADAATSGSGIQGSTND